MHRRTLLSAVSMSAVGLAGCLGADSGGEFEDGSESGDEGTSSDDDPYPDLSETQRSFVTRLDRDIEVVAATAGADELTVTVQTTGTASEDLRIVAEVYLNFAAALSVDLRTRIEDRGLSKSSFVIRREWATQFTDGEIDSDEYLSRIRNTRTKTS